MPFAVRQANTGRKGIVHMRYQLLGPSGLRVSQICLGTMSFGQQWGFGADVETSHAILDAFFDAGGTFVDTANKYHGGETEEILGRWLPARREHVVLGTKYTLAMDHSNLNSGGNHRRNLVRSVEASLRRLQTDYIDLMWVHAWDDCTPYQETLRALDDLVRAGKVLYLGVSDTPAWVVSASNVYADLRSLTGYSAIQVEYSLIERTAERELIPMAQHNGLSVLGWAPLGAGLLTGKYTRNGAENDSLRKAGNEQRGRTSERNLQIARTVDAVADELGVTSASVATAWVLSQGYGMLPIVGARKVAQLRDVLTASDLVLEAEHLERLDEVSRVALGFPHEFLGTAGVQDLIKTESRGKLDGRP